MGLSAGLSKLASHIIETVSPRVAGIAVKGDTIISKQGPKAQALWNLIKSTRTNGERALAPHMGEYLSKVEHLTDSQWDNVVKEIKTGQVTSAAAITTDMKMAEVYNNFENLVQQGVLPLTKSGKMPIGPPTENYFPKIPKEGAIEELRKAGLIDQANKVRTLTGGRKFQNVEKRRFDPDIPESVWRTDKAVPLDYLKRGWQRIEEIKNFGPKDEVLLSMLDDIKKESGQSEYNYVKWLSEQFLERRIGEQGIIPGLTQSSVEKGIGSLEALTKLSLAFVPQAFQALNIPPFLRGLSPVIRGFARNITEHGDAYKYALESGAITHDAYVQARRTFLNETNLGSNMLKYTGFTWFDKQLRIVAANAGRDAAETAFAKVAADPTDKGAIQLLSTLGVDVREALKRGTLSADDVLNAGKSASDMTQFRTDVSSVPPAWRTSTGGRVLSLYKTFAFQQSSFLYDKVFKPAFTQGDVKPLVYLSLLFPTVGEIAADVQNMIRVGNLEDRPDGKFLVDRLLDNASHVGVTGLMFDMARSMSYDDKNAFWRFLGGPVLSDVVDFGQMSVHAFTDKHPLDKLGKDAGRKLLRSVPLAGARLTREVFGKPKNKTTLQKGSVTKSLRRLTNGRTDLPSLSE